MAEERVKLEDVNAVAESERPEDEPARVFTDAYEFVEAEVDPPTPLWGTAEEAVIAAGSLNILAGRPAVGKTSLILDLVCNLAAGLPYPPRAEHVNGSLHEPWPAPRPLRIAIVENEGPQEMFRQKLAKKLTVFKSFREGPGCVMIQTWRWGGFSFADPAAVERARLELDWEGIDLVVGDPLSMLGMEGVGSPEDTRNFVRMLQPLGFRHHRAFLFLHHFRERVERTEDELARISGAWGGHLDTLITLSAGTTADQARLAFPKLRWGSGKPPTPLILGRVWNMAAFEAIGEEGEVSLLEPVVHEHLERLRETGGGRGGKGWSTVKEIASAVEARHGPVKSALEGAPHLFSSITGQAAKDVGARGNALLWGLAEWTRVGHSPSIEHLLQERADREQADPDLSRGRSTFQGDDDIPF